MIRTPRRRRAAVVVAASALATLSACGGVTESQSEDEKRSLNIIIPAEPGGGWDQTGRAMQEVLRDTKIVPTASVENIGGAGGMSGLKSVSDSKDPDTLMVMGYVMVGAVETNKSAVTLDDTRPIAKLTEEQLVVVVPAKSPYKDINDLLDAAKEEGQGVSIAGGSAGGADHILAGLLYENAEIEPKDLNYVPFSGGGESLAAMLGNKVDAGISGVGEYEEQITSGKLRALAVSGDSPVRDLPDVPTLTDQGIDLVVNNWRGVVAPGNIDDDKADQLTELVEELYETDEWKTTVEENGWDDAFMVGDEFQKFLDEDIETVKATLKQIGLI